MDGSHMASRGCFGRNSVDVGSKDGRESGGLYGGVYNCLLFSCAAVFYWVYVVVYGPHDCKRLLLLEELASLSSW